MLCRTYRLHLRREEGQLFLVCLGAGDPLPVRAALSDIQQRLGAVLRVGLLEPGRVAQRSVVGEQVHIVVALQRLHAQKIYRFYFTPAYPNPNPIPACGRAGTGRSRSI